MRTQLMLSQRRRRLPPTVVQRAKVVFEVDGTGNSSDYRGTLSLPAPVTPSNTVEVYLCTNQFNTITSVTDDLGNTYTLDTNPASMTVGNMRAWFFRRSNLSNAPQSFIVNSANPFFQTRMYIAEVAGLDNTSPIDGTPTAALYSSAAELSSLSYTTAYDDSLVFSFVQNSPSRIPTAVAPAVLSRLEEDPIGTPYTAAVSEHSLHQLCAAAGANTIQSTWTGQGNSEARVYGIAYKKATGS